jgi:prevent-host-death family protein
MKTIGAFDAKTHLSDLLEQVSRGESFVITKRGKPMASLAPLNVPGKNKTVESIREFRKKFGKPSKKFSVEEIKELVASGRR